MLKKKLLSSFIIYGLGTGISKSILIFLIPVYTTYFSKEQYGTLDIIQSGIVFLMIFALMQLESAVGRDYFTKHFKNNKSFYISTAFWVILGLSLAVMSLSIFCSKQTSIFFFNTAKWSKVFTVASFSIPFAAIFSFFTALMRFEQKPIVYSIITLIQILTTVSVAIWLVVKLNFGIIGVFYGQLAGFVLGGLLYLGYFKKHLLFIVDKEILNSYFHFSLPMIPSVLGNWANNHLNRFLMLSFFTVGQIGIYAAVFKVASVFKLIEIAFRMAWQPFFIEQYSVNKNHKDVFKKVFKFTMIGVLILVIITTLLSKFIMKILTTPEYYEGYKFLGIISLSFGLVIIASTINLGPVLKKKTIYNTYGTFISVFFNFSFLIFLAPRYGLLGAAISLLIGNFVMLICRFYFSEKLYPVYTKK